jgi:hypothetical protein
LSVHDPSIPVTDKSREFSGSVQNGCSVTDQDLVCLRNERRREAIDAGGETEDGSGWSRVELRLNILARAKDHFAKVPAGWLRQVLAEEDRGRAGGEGDDQSQRTDPEAMATENRASQCLHHVEVIQNERHTGSYSSIHRLWPWRVHGQRPSSSDWPRQILENFSE